MAALTRLLRRCSRSDSGAELIEFALVFPMLLLVVLGIIDFGLLFQRLEVLTNAAREGARVSVLPGYGAADVQSRVDQYAEAGGLGPPGTVTTAVGAAQTLELSSGCIAVTPVTVTYTHQYMFVGAVMGLFSSALTSKELSVSSAMRSETGASPCP